MAAQIMLTMMLDHVRVRTDMFKACVRQIKMTMQTLNLTCDTIPLQHANQIWFSPNEVLKSLQRSTLYRTVAPFGLYGTRQDRRRVYLRGTANVSSQAFEILRPFLAV